MDGFFQAAAAVLVTVVLSLTISHQNPSFSSLLSMAMCAMVLIFGLRYLQPVAVFLDELENLGNLSGEMTKILLKTTLIGILAEIAALICIDGGQASLAQALRMAAAATMLYQSLPVLRGMLELIREILEGM